MSRVDDRTWERPENGGSLAAQERFVWSPFYEELWSMEEVQDLELGQRVVDNLVTEEWDERGMVAVIQVRLDGYRGDRVRDIFPGLGPDWQ